jgi:hypothetical protein
MSSHVAVCLSSVWSTWLSIPFTSIPCDRMTFLKLSCTPFCYLSCVHCLSVHISIHSYDITMRGLSQLSSFFCQ